MNRLKSFIKSIPQLSVGIAVILISIVLSWILIFSGRSVSKEEVSVKSVLVETIDIKKGAEQVNVTVFGEVKAKRSLAINPEVGGRVIELSPKFIDGGLLQKGDVILRIDPRDYINAVEQQKAEVKKAEFELKLEEGRQVVAKREWEILGEEIKKADVSEVLALRKPQLAEKQAAYEAAKSRLDKAELDLKRSVIFSPFNAAVISEEVEIGQIVTQQSRLGTIVSTDVFEVQVSIPFDKLSWIDIPRFDKTGSKAIISQQLGSGETASWEGEVLRLLTDVDPNGRMARIKVGVIDPLGIKSDDKGQYPLLIGTYVRVEIIGPEIDDVVVLPREAIREGNRVWIKSPDNTLEVRKVNIVYKLPQSVIIDKGLTGDEEIIISAIPVAIPGMLLRVDGGPQTPEAEE